jgi:hypothetical protein
MSQPFEIQFDFPLAPSNLIIPLKATAELHHSEPYYRIENIRVAGANPGADLAPILPEFEIKRIEQDSSVIWVHCDSGKESLLSIAAGNAIEKTMFNKG